MIAPYTPYADWAFRCYLQAGQRPERFPTHAKEANWDSCEKVFKQATPFKQTVMKNVYISSGTVRDAVMETAKQLNVPEPAVWKIISWARRNFAVERGLDG